MFGEALLERVSRDAARGQAEIAQWMKRMLARSGEPFASRLDYGDDSVFLNPSLFAFFSVREKRAGLSVREKRAGSDFDLARIFRDGRSLDPIAGTNAVFGDPEDPLALAALGPLGERIQCREPVTRAFAILRSAAPKIHAEISRVTRRIVAFQARDRDSFASFSAHGAVFLCVPEPPSEVFFVEDLAHQCGHVLLNAMTLDKQTLFAVDPDASLRRILGRPGETRTLYELFDGVFTESLMSLCLEACTEELETSARQAHERRRRLAFLMRRFEADLSSLRALRFLSLLQARGLAMLEEFQSVFDEVLAASDSSLWDFDFCNQPYAFDYARFAARNTIAAVPSPESRVSSPVPRFDEALRPVRSRKRATPPSRGTCHRACGHRAVRDEARHAPSARRARGGGRSLP